MVHEVHYRHQRGMGPLSGCPGTLRPLYYRPTGGSFIRVIAAWLCEDCYVVISEDDDCVGERTSKDR